MPWAVIHSQLLSSICWCIINKTKIRRLLLLNILKHLRLDWGSLGRMTHIFPCDYLQKTSRWHVLVWKRCGRTDTRRRRGGWRWQSSLAWSTSSDRTVSPTTAARTWCHSRLIPQVHISVSHETYVICIHACLSICMHVQCGPIYLPFCFTRNGVMSPKAVTLTCHIGERVIQELEHSARYWSLASLAVQEPVLLDLRIRHVCLVIPR